jgi:hypothetical protein
MNGFFTCSVLRVMISRNMRCAEDNIMHERNDKYLQHLIGNVTGGYHLGDTNVGWMILLEMIFKKCCTMLFPLSKTVMMFLVSYMARKFFSSSTKIDFSRTLRLGFAVISLQTRSQLLCSSNFISVQNFHYVRDFRFSFL